MRRTVCVPSVSTGKSLVCIRVPTVPGVPDIPYRVTCIPTLTSNRIGFFTRFGRYGRYGDYRPIAYAYRRRTDRTRPPRRQSSIFSACVLYLLHIYRKTILRSSGTNPRGDAATGLE